MSYRRKTRVIGECPDGIFKERHACLVCVDFCPSLTNYIIAHNAAKTYIIISYRYLSTVARAHCPANTFRMTF